MATSADRCTSRSGRRPRLPAGTRVSLLLISPQVATAGAAFAVNILAALSLGAAGRGQLAVLLQISYVATVLVLLGLERSYTAGRTAEWAVAVAEMRRLMRPAWWCLAAAAVVLGALSALQPEVLLYVALVSFIASNAAMRVLRVAFIASQRARAFLLLTVGPQLLLVVLSVVGFVEALDSPSTWFAFYCVAFLPALIGVFCIGRSQRAARGVTANRAIRRAGLALLPSTLANVVMLRADRLLLPVLASVRELGLYVVVATVMELAAWPTQNVVDANLRRWRAAAERNDLAPWRLVLVGLLGTAVVAGVFALVLLLALARVLGEEFDGARVLVLPLAVATLLYATSRVLLGLLIAAGEHRRVSQLEVSGSVVAVVLYLLLIPWLGGVGAALASGISYGLVCLAGVVNLRRSRRTGGPSSAPVESSAPSALSEPLS